MTYFLALWCGCESLIRSHARWDARATSVSWRRSKQIPASIGSGQVWIQYFFLYRTEVWGRICCWFRMGIIKEALTVCLWVLNKPFVWMEGEMSSKGWCVWTFGPHLGVVFGKLEESSMEKVGYLRFYSLAPRTRRQKLMQRPWRGETYWLAFHGLLSLHSYITQDHLPKVFPSHNGLDLLP